MIEVLATIASIVGALIVAQGKPNLMPAALIVYIIGSIFWGTLGLQNALYGLVLTNVLFIIIESYALYKWYTLSKKEKKVVDKIIEK